MTSRDGGDDKNSERAPAGDLDKVRAPLGSLPHGQGDGMERNAEKQLEITFENVEVPESMKAKLESSPFFKKCSAPKAVQIVGATVIFSFPSTLDRQGVLKKRTQTFKPYSPYQTHHVVEKGSLHHAARAGHLDQKRNSRILEF